MVFFAGAGKDQYGVDVSMDQTDSRTMNHEKVSRRQEVQFKLHPSNEIANLFQDNSLVRSTPLTLEAGFEYFLDVTPHVVATTDAFKEMDTKQRKCKLQNEIYEKSIFRVYKMEKLGNLTAGFFFDAFSGNSSSWNFRNLEFLRKILEFWAKILEFSVKSLSFQKNPPALGENVEFLQQKLT